MQRNQKTYIFDLSSFKAYIEYYFLKQGTLIFESDIQAILLEVVECCLGNATRDNITRCQRNIFTHVPHIVGCIDGTEMSEIINILCNELEATHLHTMRMDADQEPNAFCFSYDGRISRLNVSSESLSQDNGWVDHRAYTYEMQSYLNGGIHEPVQSYPAGFNFRWRAV